MNLGVASREWFDTVMPFLLLHGWEQIGDEECFLQLRQDGKIVMRMTMHIEDFQITAKNDVIASAWIKTLLARFDGAEQKPDKNVGYQVRYDGAAGTCPPYKEDYILALLNKHQTEICNGSDTPIESASGKCEVQVGSAKCRWEVQSTSGKCKVQSASGKCKVQVGCAKCKWQVQGASGKRKVQVESRECKWEVETASGKWKVQVKSAKCKWEVQSASGKCKVQVASAKCKVRVASAKCKWEVCRRGRERCRRGREGSAVDSA